MRSPRSTLAVVLLVATTSCAPYAPVVADDATERLRPLTAAASECIASAGGRTDASAATCTCHALGGALAGKGLDCHEGPKFLAFKGAGLPIEARKGDRNYYALGYVPGDRFPERTKDHEVTFWGYATLQGAAGLPPHWYALVICGGCD